MQPANHRKQLNCLVFPDAGAHDEKGQSHLLNNASDSTVEHFSILKY